MINNIIIVFVAIVCIAVFLLSTGKALEKDLKDLETTNPKFRKYLKDKYNI